MQAEGHRFDPDKLHQDLAVLGPGAAYRFVLVSFADAKPDAAAACLRARPEHMHDAPDDAKRRFGIRDLTIKCRCSAFNRPIWTARKASARMPRNRN